MRNLYGTKLADENPFPDQSLGIHWYPRKYGGELWDEGHAVGSIKPAFGGGWWISPYWREDNTDAFDTEEEAKAYLVTIYRLESTTYESVWNLLTNTKH